MKKTLCMLLAMLMLLGLCACGQSGTQEAKDTAPAEAAAQEEATDVAYRVAVTDEQGNPIPGVKLQFCDDASCTMGDTDGNGVAVFPAKEGSYTVHVLKAPEDFVGTEEEFAFPEADTQLQITLKTLTPAFSKPTIGFSFYNPEAYENSKGTIEWEANRLTYDIYVLNPRYYAVPKGDTDALWALQDVYGKLYEYEDLFDVLCVLKDGSEAEAYLKDNIRPSSGWEAFSLQEIGSAGNLTCFLAQRSFPEEELEQYKSAMGEFYEEFTSLREDRETFLSGVRLREPQPEILSFETQDLDGNPVNLADVFADHKVTMVNLWATWCAPCKEELPGLEQLNRSFAEQDCQIIGICMNCSIGGDTSEAKEILEQAGVTYLNLVVPDTEQELLKIDSYPTSYFVDSEGKNLTVPVPYAYSNVSAYNQDLASALARLEG